MQSNSVSFRKQQIARHIRVVAARNPHYVFRSRAEYTRECNSRQTAYYLALEAQQRYQKSAQNAGMAAALAQINASRGSPDAHACSAAAATTAATCAGAVRSMIDRLVHALGAQSTTSADLATLTWFDKQLEAVHGPYTQSFEPKPDALSLDDLDFSRPCDGLSTDVVQELAELNRKLAEQVRTLVKADECRQLVDGERQLVDDQRKRLDEERRLADGARTTVDDARLATDSQRAAEDINRGKMDLARHEMDKARSEADGIRRDIDLTRGKMDLARGDRDTLRQSADYARSQIDAKRCHTDAKRTEADKARVIEDAARVRTDEFRMLNDEVRHARDAARKANDEALVAADEGNREVLLKVAETLRTVTQTAAAPVAAPATRTNKLSPRTTIKVRAQAGEASNACHTAIESIVKREDYSETEKCLINMQLQTGKTFLKRVHDDL